jgi:hypothetical protein
MRKKMAVCSLAVALLSAGTALAAPVPLTQLAALQCPYETCGTSIGARIKGAARYLYAATGSSLKVYDVRTPGAPVAIANIPSLALGGNVEVIVSGRYLYLANGSGVLVADAKDPVAPVLVSRVTFPTAGGAFAAAYGKYVFAGLNVVDVSDPGAPTVVGRLAVSGSGTATGLAVSGTNAYVVDDTGRLHIVDVSDPTASSEIGYLDFGEPAYDIAVSGTYAYVVTHGTYCDAEGCTNVNGSLRVLDISGGSCAKPVSTIGRPKAPEGVLVSGGYAYVVEQSTNFYSYAGELTVVDVRNAASPVDVAWAGTPTFANSYVIGYGPTGVAAVGNAVYLTTPWGLYVYAAFSAAPAPYVCQ